MLIAGYKNLFALFFFSDFGSSEQGQQAETHKFSKEQGPFCPITSGERETTEHMREDTVMAVTHLHNPYRSQVKTQTQAHHETMKQAR